MDNIAYVSVGYIIYRAWSYNECRNMNHGVVDIGANDSRRLHDSRSLVPRRE